MADPAGSDKFLLERLNALKPTSIDLSPSPKPTISAASTIERAKPPSKEDALSDRLKSLRDQIGSSSSPPEQHPPASPGSGKAARQPHTHSTSAAAPPPPQPQASGTTDGNIKADRGATQSPTTTGTQTQTQALEDDDGDVQLEPLLDTDDQTLEELLAELGSDQAWLDEVAAEGEERENEEQEHRRVTALLEELGKASMNDAPQRGSAKGQRSGSDGDSDSDSDDDSEGGQMTREADDVLAKALDEVELDGNRQPDPLDPASTTPPASHTNQSGRPQTNRAPPETQGQPDEPSPFNLPGVPSQLQDQPSIPDGADDDGDLSETDTNFEASIAARMAALKVSSPSSLSPDNPILPSVPASDLNALGLPGAPTFSPHDRPVPGLIKRPPGGGRLGFTDEDQKSWCIVCLEEGAIRCLGCDDGDDVYCARCWKEMHVGPRAGYEERGHRWEKFVRVR